MLGRNHCTLGHNRLAVQINSNKKTVTLKNVLAQEVKNVNFIKSQSSSSYLFSIVFGKMGTAHKTLLLHNEV